MADNLPPTPPPASRTTPPLKGTGLTGSLKNPTQRLPIPIRTAGGGKIVVMLSSVAKPPPASPVLTPRPAAGATAPVAGAPPLPPKQVTPAPELPTRSQLSATTYVKLPPKTTAPGWSSLSGKPLTPQPVTPLPTPVHVSPPKVTELTKKAGAQNIPPIKLNEPVSTSESPLEESIFLAKATPAPAPEVSKLAVPNTPMPITTTAPMVRPEPIAPVAPPVAKAPEGNPVSLESFVQSQTPAPKVETKPAPVPEAKAAPLKAPALMPPNLATPLPATGGGLRPVRPPPLPPTLTKPMGSVLNSAPVTAPAPPVTPVAPPKVEIPPKLPEVGIAAPVPASAKPETSAAALLAAEMAIIAPILDKPAAPVAEKLPPPLAATPPPLPITSPKLEKAPEPVVEKLPPPLTKPVEPPSLPVPALHVAPPPLEKRPEPVAEKLPQPLPSPLAKPVEAPVLPVPVLHVAPPLLEKAPEPAAEKLPQPHLPLHAPVAEARKADVHGTPEPIAKPVQKAPAMIPSDTTSSKPSAPPEKRRSITSWLKKTPPVVVSSASTKPLVAPVAEPKPALKPPTLPSRSQSLSKPEPLAQTTLPFVPAPKVDAPKSAIDAKVPEKVAPLALTSGEKTVQPSVLKSAAETAVAAVVAPGAIVAALAADKKKSKEISKGDAKPPIVPLEPRKVEVPLTRAERAKRRQLYSLIFFWAILFPAAIGLLFWASLQVGRDTRMEGQVIPPPGTVLSNEVWIVTDFRPLASGITEDLAAERTPLMQEIQERQDHVQRAQADVASREERIRLIQEQIAAHKSEIEAVVKQARDATQKVWDVDGAAVDNEYASRMNALKRTIADRAKSLNLKYTPDDTYNSPEVWANAYRLALYEVPTGVDGVKEHAWLSDQMKAWRDYQKSADDQKEALREKAAQIKLGPAPKITDLNAKIDELQQRIDATESEEVPLKAELQQAQSDLVTAQSADVGLDDKYYKQLYSLPGESVIKRIPLATNGRFTWVDDNVFLQGESQHSYYIFARATRADGRQFWSLGRIGLEKNHVFPVVFEPDSFLSTKAILRPTLSPEEIEQ